MSDHEIPDLEEEETAEGWQEYWFVVGGVSEKATEAIESVDGKVVRVTNLRGFSVPALYAVCLLYEDGDDDQGFSWHTDDGKQARDLFIASADAHHDLYIYCADGSAPRFESDTTQLRIVTQEEWFKIADEREKDQQAIKEAEKHILYQYTDLSRHTIRDNWQLEPEELAKLEFNENGYLVCGIASSKIREHVTEPDEEWIIEVTPEIGIEVETELLRVYQALNGDWIVEAA